MAEFRKRGDRHRYWFVDAKCIEATFWAPGLYQHRGATMSGSRNTGTPDSPRCMNNAYHGCPHPESARGYDVALGQLRRKEGWRRG